MHPQNYSEGLIFVPKMLRLGIALEGKKEVFVNANNTFSCEIW